MSSVVATKDANSRVTVKTPHGPLNLSESQAKTQFVPSIDVVRTFTPNTTGSFSTYSEWLLDPASCPDHVTKITYSITLSAATKTGGTVISPRW